MKILSGVVVSDKMAKTVVVEVRRFVPHSKYDKYQVRSKCYQAHDENKKYKTGDKIKIRETRPISRHKHFEVID